jgi:hypothetical protein
VRNATRSTGSRPISGFQFFKGQSTDNRWSEDAPSGQISFVQGASLRQDSIEKVPLTFSALHPKLQGLLFTSRGKREQFVPAHNWIANVFKHSRKMNKEEHDY